MAERGQIEPHDLDRRADVARRLKAARWLAGTVRSSTTGRSGFEVVALTTRELAARAPLPENKITDSLLGSIERMERHTPPMELRAIAEALGLPASWFVESGVSQALTPEQLRHAAELLAPQLLTAAQELRRDSSTELGAAVEPGRPPGAAGGGGG